MSGKDPWNKGRVGVFTDESIQKIKDARATQIFTDESIKKKSASLRQSWPARNRYKGGQKNVKARKVVYQQKREARKKGNGGTYTLEEWVALLEKCQNMCLCCKRTEPEIKLTVDHIIPISKGGRNEITNLQPLCFSCNARKRDKHIDYISQFQLQIIGTQS